MHFNDKDKNQFSSFADGNNITTPSSSKHCKAMKTIYLKQIVKTYIFK